MHEMAWSYSDALSEAFFNTFSLPLIGVDLKRLRDRVSLDR